MRIGVLPIGETDASIIAWVKENLTRVFPDATCVVVDETVPLREEAFDEKRRQYQ